MLSPASHRVCCLAVMAPALTKADRQADCLPVVLSESFCVSKASDTFNGEGRISEIRLKCAYSSEYTQSKRRALMQRACWRTPKNSPGSLCKYRSVINDSSKSLLFTSRVRTQTKYKTWQSTKATTAYADKIKLKYTMNKNTSSLKNMGLAKANTSLGLQSLKMKQFSKENLNTSPNVEDSLNFSDSADSTIQVEPPVSDLTALTSNSDSYVCPVDGDMKSCVSNGKRTFASTPCTESDTTYTTVCESELETNSQPPLMTTGSNSIEAMDSSNTSVTLTDLLCSTAENSEPSNILCKTSSMTDVTGMNSEVVDQSSSVELQSSTNDSVLEMLQQSEVCLPSETNSVIPFQYFGKEMQSSFSKFNISNDTLLSLFNSSSGSNVMSHYPILCSKLRDTCKSHPILEERIKYPVIRDNRFGFNYLICVRKESKPCCLLSSQELVSLESVMADKETSVLSTLASSTLSLQKPVTAHIKNQISNLVDHYQRKLQIPCQRQAKHINAKTSKDMVDLKAELLQSEDVKSMSTAALVNLVRKLESSGSGSQAKILSPNVSISSVGSDLSENVVQEFEPEDITDIKYTSGILLRKLKSIVKFSDPDLTDSSEEESETESEEEETPENSVNKIALWKYLTERAKLGSRSTWLIARIHELDYRIKEYNERLNEIVKSEGRVSLEEPIATSSSALSSQECDNASLQTSVKQAAVKSFLLPLNGFLDRSDASHIAKTAASESFLSELEDPERTESNTEVEGSCCRTRPLNVGTFRKRKLVFIPGLHANPKFSRLSTVNCNCNSQSDLAPCILCTGQYTSIQSIDPDSMALRDRIAILDPYFHPALSTEKDIPLTLHMENVLKCHPKFQFVPETSVDTKFDNEAQTVRPRFSDLRSHRKLRQYTKSLSAKYRKRRHARNTRHLRKHKLVFGKWRRIHNKHTFRARSRFRRYSVASSGSSPDSPVHSPMSVFDDGYEKKRRDDSQFDIDDVIIPCNSRTGRLVEIQYKEIVIPSWRSREGTSASEVDMEDVENITDSYLIKRHDMLEIEEKEKVKRTALGLNKRGRRNRCDSRADSSGANTPDPISLYNQNVFQVSSFMSAGGPASPASPATPGSAIVSDDSQPASGNSLLLRPEKRKLVNQKRSIEDNISNRPPIDFDEVPPYEPLVFPLSNEVYEQLLAETDHDKEVLDIPPSTPSFPASPVSSTSSTSTVEEDEDITDPEWTVVKPTGNLDQALVLKFAKR